MPTTDIINRIRQLAPEERNHLKQALDNDPILGNIVLKMFPEMMQAMQQQPGQTPPGAQPPIPGQGAPVPPGGAPPMPPMPQQPGQPPVPQAQPDPRVAQGGNPLNRVR